MHRIVDYGRFEILSEGTGSEGRLMVVFHTGVGNLSTYTGLLPYLMQRKETVASFTLEDPEGYLKISSREVAVETGRRYGRFLASLNKPHYHLIGHCIGGLFALEAARELEAGGFHVELTLIDNTLNIMRDHDFSYISSVLDSPVILERMFGRLMGADLTEAGYLISDERMNEAVAEIRKKGGLFDEKELACMKGSFADVSACYKKLLGKSHEERFERLCRLMGDIPAEQYDYQKKLLVGMFALFKHSIRASLYYVPEKYYGPVSLVICQEEVKDYYLNTIDVFSNQKEVWEGVFGEKVRYFSVPGDHFSCLQKPLVTALIDIFKETE